MIAIQEKNYINRYNELKVVRTEREVSKNEALVRLLYSRKKIREKYARLTTERKKLFQLIQFHQLQVIKMSNLEFDNKMDAQLNNRSILSLEELLNQELVSLHSLDNEISIMENNYNFI